MGKKDKKEKVKIITDKPKSAEYTFIDDVSLKPDAKSDNDPSRESKRNKGNELDSVRDQTAKLRHTANSLRFKTRRNMKTQTMQNHSSVYE